MQRAVDGNLNLKPAKIDKFLKIVPEPLKADAEAILEKNLTPENGGPFYEYPDTYYDTDVGYPTPSPRLRPVYDEDSRMLVDLLEDKTGIRIVSAKEVDIFNYYDISYQFSNGDNVSRRDLAEYILGLLTK